MNSGGAPEGRISTGRSRAKRRPASVAGDGDARSAVLASSIVPIAPVTVIERPRLSSGLWRRLLLATAPAGYGKTTLLRQLWARLPEKGAVKIWLSLGPAHRDFEVFLKSLSATLKAQPVAPQQWRGEPEEMGARLASAFAEAGAPSYLMLDDYHAASGPALDSFVRAMSGASGDALHLAISTRTRAKVGAGVLAARGDLVSLGAADLAFTLDEARRVLQDSVPAEDIAALHAQTEGWPAALQLAVRSGRSEARGQAWSLGGAGGEIGALVAEETFDPLSEALQDLLIETAYLETLNTTDADAVRGRGDSEGLLAELEGSAALVFPDRDQPDQLRRHALLRRLLEARFTLLDEKRRSELAVRTMSRLAQRGDIGPALRLAHRPWAPLSALALLETAPLESFWTARAIVDLPSEAPPRPELPVAGAPHVTLLHGLSLYAEGSFADARAAFENGIAEMGKAQPAGIPRAAARGWTAWQGLRAAIFDETPSGQLADDLSTLAREVSSRESVALPAHAASVLALRAGRSREASDLAQLIATGAGDHRAREFGALHEAAIALLDASPRRAAAALSRLNGVALDHPNLDSALRLCRAWLAYETGASWSVADLPRDTPPMLLGLSPELLVEHARIAAAEAGRDEAPDAAGAVLQHALVIARERGWRRSEAMLEAEALNTMLRAGRRDAAVKAAAEALKAHGEEGSTEALLALARLDISNGAHKRARARLGPLLTAANLVKRQRIEALLLDARAAHALNRPDEVETALGQFLALSSEGVMTRCFHDDGAGLWDPLMALASKMATADPDGSHLDIVADLAVTRPSYGDTAALDPPTLQESMMFAALRRKGSRAAAALDLAMSENTLKYYLKRVFERWGVRDWRLAMRIAERLAA